MRGMIMVAILAGLSTGAFAGVIPGQPGGPPPPPPPPGGPGGPGGHGLMALLRPEPSQFLPLARFALKARRAGVEHLASLAALRLELVEQLVADRPDDKVADAKVDAIAAELAKTADDAVALVFELRELMTPEQRQAVSERLAVALIGGEPPHPGGGPGGHGMFPPPPPPPPDGHALRLTVEQQAKLKRLVLHAAPAIARSGGEAVARLLEGAGELIAPEPARERVKAAADGAVKEAVTILRAAVALAREARAVLEPGQLEQALALVPMPWLLGGLPAMHRPPPPPR